METFPGPSSTSVGFPPSMHMQCLQLINFVHQHSKCINNTMCTYKDIDNFFGLEEGGLPQI